MSSIYFFLQVSGKCLAQKRKYIPLYNVYGKTESILMLEPRRNRDCQAMNCQEPEKCSKIFYYLIEYDVLLIHLLNSKCYVHFALPMHSQIHFWVAINGIEHCLIFKEHFHFWHNAKMIIDESAEDEPWATSCGTPLVWWCSTAAIIDLWQNQLPLSPWITMISSWSQATSVLSEHLDATLDQMLPRCEGSHSEFNGGN